MLPARRLLLQRVGNSVALLTVLATQIVVPATISVTLHCVLTMVVTRYLFMRNVVFMWTAPFLLLI
jgi:hypothetical protein